MNGAVEKGLALFASVLGEDAPLSELALRVGVAESTARRMVLAYVRQGMLSRTGRGRYGVGLSLAALAGGASVREVLIRASTGPCRDLAARIGTTVHLGVLEGDMVTYLVKEQGGGLVVRTRVANQLEAYCTGIGKVLLAALEEGARERYLAGGAFVRLTEATVTDPAVLRAAILEAGARGHAADRAEFVEGVYCLAVPVVGPGQRVVAALSASSRTDRCDDAVWLGELRACARRVGRRLGAG